jgi:hypothetical protein
MPQYSLFLATSWRGNMYKSCRQLRVLAGDLPGRSANSASIRCANETVPLAKYRDRQDQSKGDVQPGKPVS